MALPQWTVNSKAYAHTYRQTKEKYNKTHIHKHATWMNITHLGKELILCLDFLIEFFPDIVVYCTAPSLEDETRNGRWSTERNPWWSSQGSFHTAYCEVWKEASTFSIEDFRFVFWCPFRVTSSREQAVYIWIIIISCICVDLVG